MDEREREMIIRKETVAVELCTSAGDIARGDVFLRPPTDGDDRGERLIDVLSGRRFVPLKTPDKLLFIAAKHVSWARIDLLAAIDELDPEAEDDENSATAHVVVTLVDGGRLDGSVRYSMPAPMRRLGDYLEKLALFFPLRTDDYVYLVNSACVTSVVPLEEKR